MLIKLKRGFDVSMTGAPEQVIHEAPRLRTVALVAADYVDLRETLTVSEGERVRLGQALFTDRRHGEVRYTTPGSGRVRTIHRGAKRRVASVVIELDDRDADDAETFPSYEPGALRDLKPDAVREILLRSGLWTAFRSRPYGRVPTPVDLPRALFVTAIDTQPLAGDPAVVIGAHLEDFQNGLAIVSCLATEKTFVCTSASMQLPSPDLDGLVTARFQGPHPAGLPGTHIHHLASDWRAPIWYVGYQDVIAIGRLFVTGRIWTERVVALGGPGLEKPRLVRTRIGASIDDLLGDAVGPNCRVISGSVLSGRHATLTAAHLGRYHQQVTVLPEAAGPEAASGLLARLIGRSRASMPADTSVNGSPGGMLPVEAFEQVWPLEIPPAPLLRALLVRDTETARQLGCLALEEEDLALCSYVCPAKYDYGSALRATLRAIERTA